MIVYSNTTPIIALASIGRLDLLSKVFNKVHVAQAVVDECSVGGRIFVPPLEELDWIIIVPDEENSHLTILIELDRGEKQTVLLARKHNADKVIVDERLGRSIAEYLGLSVTGTLGILAKAKSLGLIQSFQAAAFNMREQGIYYNESLILRIANRLGER